MQLKPFLSRAGLLLAAMCVTTKTCWAEVPVNGLTDAERRGGWQLIFDGESKHGWRNYRKETISDGWQVRDGALVRAANGAGDIITEKQYEFFELSLEYRISKAGNSGIMFRVTEEGDTPWKTGPEIQVQDNIDGHDPQKAGWLYQLYRPNKPQWAKQFEKQVGFDSPDVEDATRPVGEWNHMYLRISPQQCEVCLNGFSYYKFQLGTADWNKRVAASKFAEFSGFGKAEKGYICLQDHGDEVAYRNIKLRELPNAENVPDPSDGDLNVKVVEAFPKIQWDGWEGIDDDGRIHKLRPLALTDPRDGSGRLLCATQDGMVHIFPNDPNVEKTKLLLDIRERVADFEKGNEEGLLGLAVPAEFGTKGEFYVYYTSATETRTSIVSRFRVSKDDPERADPDSEEIVMKIPQPFSNHNGGCIEFGPDGYLYIGLGDGGSRNDPLTNGQNLETWMGSILRIDVTQHADGKNYAIPSDNPFRDHAGAQPEIYAIGLRNVWRLSFDSKTGTLWAADVGQDRWEEINIIQRGGNYGWSVRESNYPFGNKQSTVAGAPIDPVWEYDHLVGKSITGGIVYRGSRVPALDGLYLYADFVTGRIWGLDYDVAAGKVVRNMRIATDGIPVLAFGQDANGEVYYMIESVNGHSVFKFEPTDG